VRKLHATPSFVAIVVQNPETKPLLQLTTDVGLIVAPDSNKMVNPFNISNIAKLIVFNC
jgi:hypothetical protein